jgi:hypothetical protein
MFYWLLFAIWSWDHGDYLTEVGAWDRLNVLRSHNDVAWFELGAD